MFNAFKADINFLVLETGESFCKLCMTQNVHIVVVEYGTYNCIACTRNAPRVVLHAKDLPRDRKHQGYQYMSR